MALRSIATGLVSDVWEMLDSFALSNVRVDESSAGSFLFPGGQEEPEGDVGLDKGGEGGKI